ncbi:unnamed protein product [Caenorhabditis bovis]|uniref:Uncharacterized protein n=1 Tax=Caenorhabditis bovis TaxID=2654633 RepID=A0A8S1E915_9PELO|nr:unnamed protein product [Caenorhabditis bovis]
MYPSDYYGHPFAVYYGYPGPYSWYHPYYRVGAIPMWGVYCFICIFLIFAFVACVLCITRHEPEPIVIEDPYRPPVYMEPAFGPPPIIGPAVIGPPIIEPVEVVCEHQPSSQTLTPDSHTV